MDSISGNTHDYIEHTWNRIKQEYTHYIYFPIEFKSVNDGVRSVNEEWREKIDVEFKNTLDGLNKEYLTVTGSPRQRVNQILKYVSV